MNSTSSPTPLRRSPDKKIAGVAGGLAGTSASIPPSSAPASRSRSCSAAPASSPTSCSWRSSPPTTPRPRRQPPPPPRPASGGPAPSGVSGAPYPPLDGGLVRRPAAPGDHAALRLPPRGRRRAPLLGGPEGAVDDPAEKRLAVEVEDHSLEWGSFEGRTGSGRGAVTSGIAGPMTASTTCRSPRRSSAGRHRSASRGRNCAAASRSCARAGAERKPQWLLIKKRDDDAGGESPGPESVISGRTLDELD